MSTRDRLTRLTADIVAPAAPDTAAEKGGQGPHGSPPQTESERNGGPSAKALSDVETRFPAVSPRPAGKKTGPGELLAFRGQILAAEGGALRLREELRRFEDSLPTKKLDPKNVVPSRWANRHEASFATSDFIRFKSDIEHAGGNVQPILVRPLPEQEGRYEIIFGHRRHRACLEVGVPVLAAIWTAKMSDADLFAAMDRENRERADLSAWEQGSMYKRALEEQMFPSQRRLAESLGVSHTWARKALAVAELPDPIVQCFRTPLELTFRHAEDVSTALQNDRKGVLRRAEKLRQSQRISASAVVAALVGKQRGGLEPARDIRIGSKPVGRVTWDGRGQATIRLQPGIVHAENIEAVIAAVSAALGEMAQQ